MSVKFRRSVLIALTVMFWVIAGGQTAEARWRFTDPACSGFNAPSISSDPEKFFEWWGGCIDDLQEPFGGDTPPVTCDRMDGRRISDASGRCWRIICLNAYQWRLEPCIKMVSVRPGIASLFVTTSGFRTLIWPLIGKPIEVFVKPSQLNLVHLVRAAVTQTRLPSDDIFKVRPDFWSSLKGGKIMVTGTFTRS